MLHHFTLPSGATIAIDNISRSEPKITSSSSLSLSYKRRCEQSTWHALARKLLGEDSAEFEYNAVGAPEIVGSCLNISVSHSATLAAVIISPHRCAIDIELLSRDFEVVAQRYIAPSEEHLASSPQRLALMWSIKETMYKFAGKKGLNLLTDIKIHSIDDKGFTASISPHDNLISGVATIIGDHTLVYI